MALLGLFLHFDSQLAAWAHAVGPWLYLILFLIIFCETGLVVTPFLPGDSLLFAVGALTTMVPAPLDLSATLALLVAAAILGDALNYKLGRSFGLRLARIGRLRLFNPERIERTERFFQRFGPTTIVVARFVPIVRTFAPFVAGIGRMSYRRFAVYNVLGALIWVGGLVLAGHAFGNLPAVRAHFSWVVVGIVLISLMPAVVQYFLARRESRSTLAVER